MKGLNILTWWGYLNLLMTSYISTTFLFMKLIINIGLVSWHSNKNIFLASAKIFSILRTITKLVLLINLHCYFLEFGGNFSFVPSQISWHFLLYNDCLWFQNGIYHGEFFLRGKLDQSLHWKFENVGDVFGKSRNWLLSCVHACKPHVTGSSVQVRSMRKVWMFKLFRHRSGLGSSSYGNP